MKQINEVRINDTYNYIKDYSNQHGHCPTYREIKDEMNYSSLSLVYADINRLKERGLLVEGNFKQIELTSTKEERIYRYNYPFIIMTNAFNHLDIMADDEKELLYAQDNYLKGEYLLAKEQALKIVNENKNHHVVFGAKLTLCLCSMYTGESKYWTDYFNLMISYNPQTKSEKMEKELMAHFLSSSLGNRNNCPSWLMEGRFYDLRKEAYSLAYLMFVANANRMDPPANPALLEPLCSMTSLKHIDICQVYLDLYLAMSYHYTANDKYLDEHLTHAINTCLRHNWITPLAEMKRALASVLTAKLEDIDENIIPKVDELNKKLTQGMNKIYELILGDNLFKDLTFREIEIMNYMRQNYSTKEIANKLYLSSDTVKYYISSIYLKLGVNGKKELKELLKKTKF